MRTKSHQFNNLMFYVCFPRIVLRNTCFEKLLSSCTLHTRTSYALLILNKINIVCAQCHGRYQKTHINIHIYGCVPNKK